MFAVPSLATSSTALMLPASVVAAPATDQVSTRLTSVAAAAPLSDQAVADRAHQAAAIPAEDSAPAPAPSAALPVSTALPAAGASSSFLAQLFAQSDSGVALAETFTHLAPATEFNMLASYDFVKYKPSDAGLPKTDIPNDSEDVPPAAAAEYRAYAATVARSQPGALPTLALAG